MCAGVRGSPIHWVKLLDVSRGFLVTVTTRVSLVMVGLSFMNIAVSEQSPIETVLGHFSICPPVKDNDLAADTIDAMLDREESPQECSSSAFARCLNWPWST